MTDKAPLQPRFAFTAKRFQLNVVVQDADGNAVPHVRVVLETAGGMLVHTTRTDIEGACVMSLDLSPGARTAWRTSLLRVKTMVGGVPGAAWVVPQQGDAPAQVTVRVGRGDSGCAAGRD